MLLSLGVLDSSRHHAVSLSSHSTLFTSILPVFKILFWVTFCELFFHTLEDKTQKQSQHGLQSSIEEQAKNNTAYPHHTQLNTAFVYVQLFLPSMIYNFNSMFNRNLHDLANSYYMYYVNCLILFVYTMSLLDDELLVGFHGATHSAHFIVPVSQRRVPIPFQEMFLFEET